MHKTLIVALALSVSLPGCADLHVPPGELEIGVLETDGSFRALSDGDSIQLFLASDALIMITPSLRAEGVDPRRPDPHVEVEVGGITMASNLAGERVDMEEDGDGYVLAPLMVPFDVALCCFVCREGTISASLHDASGADFERQVTVRLERRGGCPDPAACCVSADSCEDPTLTLLCL